MGGEPDPLRIAHCGHFFIFYFFVGILLIEWVGGVRPNSHQAFAMDFVANGCDPKMMAQLKLCNKMIVPVHSFFIFLE
jgi:hypothetical protein